MGSREYATPKRSMNRANTTRSGVTTLVIAEDHQVVRHGLTLLLNSQPDFKLVGEANDGLEAIRLVEATEPDVLLLDLMIPQVHGLEVIGHIRSRRLATRIIILSMLKEDSMVLESLRRGATGYVLKEASSRELLEAVRQVAAGRRYLSPGLSHLLAELDRETAATARGDCFSAPRVPSWSSPACGWVPRSSFHSSRPSSSPW